MTDSTRQYAVIGSGALGAFYGSRLQRAGLAVHFLVRSDYEHVRANGWRIDSKDGDFVLPNVRVYRQAKDIPEVDVVLIGLKSTSNDALSRLLSPLVRPKTAFLVLENGLGIEDRVAEIVGKDRVLGGCCFLCSNRVGPGHIHHLDYGTVAMGDFSPDHQPAGITDRLRQIGADFERAGISIQLTDDLRLARWKKLVWNIPFNGLSVLFDAETNVLMTDPASRRLVRVLMDEVIGAARAEGRTIDEAFLQQLLSNTEKMTPYKTSMKIDFDTKQPLEIDAIFGEPIRVADRLGAPMPTVRAVAESLEFLDRRNRG